MGRGVPQTAGRRPVGAARRQLGPGGPAAAGRPDRVPAQAPTRAQEAEGLEHSLSPEPTPEDGLSGSPFQILVQPVDGPTLTLDVQLSDTVEAVKGMIQQCQGVPPNRQTLLLGSLPLETTRTLQSCGVRAGEVLRLSTRLRGGGRDVGLPQLDGPAGEPALPAYLPFMQVFVRTVSGRSLSLDASPTQEVAQIKTTIQARDGDSCGPTTSHF